MRSLGCAVAVWFLFLVPVAAAVLVGARALRVDGGYQAIGAVHFVLIVVAVWRVGGKALKSRDPARQRVATVGTLLVFPFALVALLWVGIGPPWQATDAENRMRYLVLLTNAVAVTAAFVLLSSAIQEAGERLYSALASAGNLLAGVAYVVWSALYAGIHQSRLREGPSSSELAPLANAFDALLFAACVLTYGTVAMYAISLARVGWLGRGAKRVFVVASLGLLSLVLVRGLSFPSPPTGGSPWYAIAGFVAGIPAVPWILPYLMGVLLLRRARADAR